MPRRSVLSTSDRAALLAPPVEDVDRIRLYTFSETDLALIRQRRGEANRLGFAVQLCLLRYPGTALEPEETVDAALVGWVATTLWLDPERLGALRHSRHDATPAPSAAARLPRAERVRPCRLARACRRARRRRAAERQGPGARRARLCLAAAATDRGAAAALRRSGVLAGDLPGQPRALRPVDHGPRRRSSGSPRRAPHDPARRVGHLADLGCAAHRRSRTRA